MKLIKKNEMKGTLFKKYLKKEVNDIHFSSTLLPITALVEVQIKLCNI